MTMTTAETRSRKSRRDRSAAANIFASRAPPFDKFDSSRPVTGPRDASARRAPAPRPRGGFSRSSRRLGDFTETYLEGQVTAAGHF